MFLSVPLFIRLVFLISLQYTLLHFNVMVDKREKIFASRREFFFNFPERDDCVCMALAVGKISREFCVCELDFCIKQYENAIAKM
jgi:hypothetical protein